MPPSTPPCWEAQTSVIAFQPPWELYHSQEMPNQTWMLNLWNAIHTKEKTGTPSECSSGLYSYKTFCLICAPSCFMTDIMYFFFTLLFLYIYLYVNFFTFTFDNDGTRSSKRQVTFLLLIFLNNNFFLKLKQANINVKSRHFGVIVTPFSRQSE